MTEAAAEDRRVLRTKRAIRDALTTLMEEKGFDGITVKDLTDKADINRGTFYIHYRDKYDLLEQSEMEFIAQIEKLAAEGYQAIVSGDWKQLQAGRPLPFIQKLFEHLQSNADFMRVVLGPKGDPSFQKRLMEMIRKRVALILDSVGVSPLVPIDYLTAYTSSAHLGVIQHWLESGMQASPAEAASILATLTLHGPAYVAGVTRIQEKGAPGSPGEE